MTRSFFIFLIIFITMGGVLRADPEKPEIIRQRNSDCIITSSGGEYPVFRVINLNKETGKIIYAPSSDGIVNAKISRDGKFIALAAGEIDLIEGFGVMIINCATGNKKGFLPGQPTFIKKWNRNKLVLSNTEILFSGKSPEILP